MTVTPLTIETADDVAFELTQKFDLLGVDGCEEGENAFTYFFESGHWAEVSAADHGLTYRLHQPDEE